HLGRRQASHFFLEALIERNVVEKDVRIFVSRIELALELGNGLFEAVNVAIPGQYYDGGLCTGTACNLWGDRFRLRAARGGLATADARKGGPVALFALKERPLLALEG